MTPKIVVLSDTWKDGTDKAIKRLANRLEVPPRPPARISLDDKDCAALAHILRELSLRELSHSLN